MALLDLDLEGHSFYSNGNLYEDYATYKTSPSSLRSTSHSTPYDYAYADYDTDFSVASKPFCVDFWINLPGGQHYLGILAVDWCDWTSPYYGWSLYYNLTDQHAWELVWTGAGGTGWVTFTPSALYGVGWTHIALSNQYAGGANNLRLFQDGRSLGTIYSDAGYGIPDPSVGTTFKLGVSFGIYETAPYYWIDSFRHTVGWHRWDTDFTPPTDVYADDEYTVIRLQKGKESSSEGGGFWSDGQDKETPTWTDAQTAVPSWTSKATHCATVSWIVDSNRCNVGWGAGSAVTGTTWSPDTKRAESATPVIIICPYPTIGISETSNLSVSGGRAPYTWYITAGGTVNPSGTISANIATVSADYLGPSVVGTQYVAVLDMYDSWDDQILSLTGAGYFPPRPLELWAWYKCDEGAGDTLVNSALSSTTFDPLPDIVALPGSATTWIDGYCYMDRTTRMSAATTDSPTFLEPLTLGGFMRRPANLWQFSEYDKVVWAMRYDELPHWLGLWASFPVWSSGGGYAKGVTWKVYSRGDIAAGCGPWLSGVAADQWFFVFNVVTSAGTPPTETFRWYTTTYAVDHDGKLSAGTQANDYYGEASTYYRVVAGASNSIGTDIYSWRGNVGDIVVYVPGSFPTLADWAVWYDELHGDYNMADRDGW